MDRIFSTISNIGDSKAASGDSYSDTLNNQYTVFLLLFLFIFITIKEHYVGEPISCWHPAHFEESHENYTNQICWVTNTYYIDIDEDTPLPRDGDPRDTILYYQWVGFILLGQAIMFYLPRLLWNMLNHKSGIAVTTITDAAVELHRHPSGDNRDKVAGYMVKHMAIFLREVTNRKTLSNRGKALYWHIYGNYLSFMYMSIKSLYIINIIGQIFMMDTLLGIQFHRLGIIVLERLFQGLEISVKHRFPRVSMCEFKVRRLGAVHKYAIQCALPINLYNEMVFTLLWFWFVFIGTISCASFIAWLWRAVYMPSQVHYIRSRLVAMEKLPDNTKTEKDNVESFVKKYLRRDGLFIIHLVSKNAGSLTSAELVCGLWEHYMKQKRDPQGNLATNPLIGSPNIVEMCPIPHIDLGAPGTSDA